MAGRSTEGPHSQGGRAARAALRADWFERGADALQRIFPEAPRCYVCPLCLRGFTRAALVSKMLTLEHVPPESSGGSPLVLTCQPCNTRHGGTFDRHVANMENPYNFNAGTMLDPIRMEVQFGDLTVPAKVSASGDGIFVVLSDRPGAPPFGALKAAIDEQHDVRYVFPPFSYRLALVSIWRVGYLAAFAWLGYRYIFRRDVQAIRRRLLDEDDEALTVFTTTAAEESPDTRRIVVIREPTTQRSLVVQVGRHSAILPWVDSPSNLYERLAKYGGEEASMKSHLWRPWPIEPEFAMDVA